MRPKRTLHPVNPNQLGCVSPSWVGKKVSEMNRKQDCFMTGVFYDRLRVLIAGSGGCAPPAGPHRGPVRGTGGAGEVRGRVINLR